jgi:nicotinate-nucleotide pyrophosphorylase (carboxylating)
MTISVQDIITAVVHQALTEDISDIGDITSLALFSPDELATAILRGKSVGVLSGCALLNPIFSRCDSRCRLTLNCCDGDSFQPGTIIAEIHGPICGILSGERTALNFLQRLSGIATMTARYANAIAHTHCRLLDTRKTTPTLRYFEKEAVVHGGGCNHRFGLFDMILIKDTHVKRSGGVKTALERAVFYRNNNNSNLKIEVEVQTIDEFHSAINGGPDRIMLDNMSLDEMRTCVVHRDNIKSAIELEASGNITIDTIAAVAETGVDYISVGALTHSAPALDIHLLIQ